MTDTMLFVSDFDNDKKRKVMFRKTKTDPFNRELLVFLLELSETGKLTQAAQNLGMSPAAASRALEKLRETFADPLFVATGHGMQATVRMQGLVDDLRRADRMLERLCEPAVFDPETTQRVFRIASRGLVEPSLLTYLVSRFMREASKAKLEHIYRSEDSFDALVTGELDAVVSTDIAVPPSLHCLPLFPIELGGMISKHHPLVTASRGKAPALVQLLAYRRIGLKVSPNAESSTFDRQVFGEEGKDALIAETDEPLAMVSVVAETDAVMVAPKAGVNLASRFFDVTWLPLPAQVVPARRSVRSVLVWTERQHGDQGHVWLRSLFKGWIRTEAESLGVEAAKESA